MNIGIHTTNDLVYPERDTEPVNGLSYFMVGMN